VNIAGTFYYVCAILDGFPPNWSGLCVPGDRVDAEFVLDRTVGVEPAMRFAVREGGRTIGAGIVTSVA